MKVLGYNGGLDGYLSAFNQSHDAAATLVVDGVVVAAAEEERFIREKHSGKFPIRAIEFVMEKGGVSSFEDLDLITYFHSFPLMWTDSMLVANEQRVPTVAKVAYKGLLAGMRSFHRLAGYNDHRSRNVFQKHTGYAPRSGQYQPIPHHMCHVASTFYTSPFDEALILTMDAQGEATSSMAVVGQGTHLETVAETFAPNSLGYLYMFVTKYLGFDLHDEYKVMGLAPYGNPSKYLDFFRSLVQVNADGTFDAKPELIVYLMMRDAFAPHQKLYPNDMVKALGEPRKKGEPVTQHHMDIAAALQAILEESVLASLERLQKQTGQKNLCMAGGVALNCAMNGKIVRSGLFDKVWIQPASHDAGTSLGAALYGYHNVLLQPREPGKTGRDVYLGPIHGEDQVEDALKKYEGEVSFEKHDDIFTYVAQQIADGKVVGWYQGAMEWGPRALGNRSILADARRDDMKDVVNHAVKKREGFRPFAPSCLAEDANEWFDMTGLGESPYMLFIVEVREDKRELIPAVTHVDGSARVQTVDKKDNPRYHKLLSAFKKITGVPLVLNTSFNIKGEAIVNTPHDAIRCFLGTKIDMLVVNDYAITKKRADKSAVESVPQGAQTGRLEGGQIAGL